MSEENRMKIGKLPESVLKRSVLRQIKSGNENVRFGAGVGADCAIFASKEAFTAQAVQTFFLKKAGEVAFPIIKAVNSIAVEGAEPIAVTLTILLPEEAEESLLKETMQAADETAKFLQIQIAGGHTEVSNLVKEPYVTVCAIGNLKEERHKRKAAAGEDIVLTKWAGIEGAALLAGRYEEELTKRYPLHMIEKAADFKKYLSIVPEAATAVKSNAGAMHDVSGGGIFAALWELAEKAGVGLCVDLKKIPIKQECIEVCEYFGINPYEMLSGGSLLLTAANGERLVSDLGRAGIPAAVIGRIEDNNDRVVINDEERRFLERPGTDEITKFY